MTAEYRQEVLNVILAQALQERGVISLPEGVIKTVIQKRRRIPDVMVDYRGLRVVIEGEVSDHAGAEERALTSARRRVEQGLAHIGIGVIFPAELRAVPFKALLEALRDSRLLMAVTSESGDTGYVSGNIDFLAELLDKTFDQLVQEDVVAQAVAEIDAAVEKMAQLSRLCPGYYQKAAAILGIKALPRPAAEKAKKGPIETLSPEEILAICRISGLVIINAMIFQEILASHDNRVTSLTHLLNEIVLHSALNRHWNYIVSDINYFPIFHLASQLMVVIPSHGDILKGLRILGQSAQKIVAMKAALRHDLMGRVYHKLLADKKYLGTYYTSIPAAILLLKLALGHTTLPLKWNNLDRLERLQVADLACGTGTLLMAAADTVTDNYFRACAARGEQPDVTAIYRLLTEKIIYGYDVLPSAIHLTASTLALRAPETPFQRMNLFSLPFGEPENRLGSLDFMDSRLLEIKDLFGAVSDVKQITGNGEIESPYGYLPELDLCVMNPPFTRSVGGNLLFGSLPEPERSQAQKRLQKIIQTKKYQANITAGLGAVFVALADRYLNSGGRLALVLPKAVISGVAWKPTREMLAERYHLEYIVASQDPQRWNFSESTSLSEVLLVARKKDGENDGCDTPTIALNLWRNPTTAFDALAVFHALLDNSPPPAIDQQGAKEIYIGRVKAGEALAFSWKEIKEWPMWMLPVAFAQSDLIRAAYHLMRGRLWLPGYGIRRVIPLRPLKDFGTLGPDARDMHDGFKLSPHLTAYPAFWDHDAQTVNCLQQNPNVYLSPLAKAKKKRPLRLVEDLWPLSARILLAERLRLSSQKINSVCISDSVLSNTWWPLSLKEEYANPSFEKTLILWLNSTLGMLELIANRQETEGAWVKFKKPVLSNLPVLDLAALTEEQVTFLAESFDEVSHEVIQPFPQMADDPVRSRIDAAISEALRLPDYSMLRKLLAQEPVVCLKRL